MRAEDVLPDEDNELKVGGTTVRKGTIAAFLASAKELSAAYGDDDRRARILADVEQLVPALRAVGLFDVLEIRDPALRQFVASRP